MKLFKDTVTQQPNAANLLTDIAFFEMPHGRAAVVHPSQNWTAFLATSETGTVTALVGRTSFTVTLSQPIGKNPAWDTVAKADGHQFIVTDTTVGQRRALTAIDYGTRTLTVATDNEAQFDWKTEYRPASGYLQVVRDRPSGGDTATLLLGEYLLDVTQVTDQARQGNQLHPARPAILEQLDFWRLRLKAAWVVDWASQLTRFAFEYAAYTQAQLAASVKAAGGAIVGGEVVRPPKGAAGRGR